MIDTKLDLHKTTPYLAPVTILAFDPRYAKVVNVKVEKGEDYNAPNIGSDISKSNFNQSDLNTPIIEEVEQEETTQSIQEPIEVEYEEIKEEDTEEIQESEETVEETVSESVDSGDDSDNTDDGDVSDDDTDDTEHSEPVEQPVILTDQTLLYDGDTTTGKEISRKQKYKFNKKNKHHRYK